MSGQINMSTPAKTYITSRHRLRIHPLPPPIVGHLTGLTCPECPLNSTSQLQYHPARFANPANINWQAYVDSRERSARRCGIHQHHIGIQTVSYVASVFPVSTLGSVQQVEIVIVRLCGSGFDHHQVQPLSHWK
ncbi:hypothetical protein PGT21_036117 [Puccinia graminis f. sp. tritici]|uniref:Uncharacterized protein n=1 Tax=Puccinia graminis f. sp. tritici TaxID=56615 RepID=A0A5B0QQ04_PUCGR|nr:hypothetical protein PGT21_036117 [Puccinia graminis f. sp. tritici]